MLVLLVLVARVGLAAPTAESRRGMVVTQQLLATDAGLEVLRAGGNAVDAAVAAAFALAVVHPPAGNLGGGGFLMFLRARDSLATCIDFRETAPMKAHRDIFLNAQGEVDTTLARIGHASVGVPGTPAGLYLAWSKYGSRPWRSLIAPAMKLAQDGFPVNEELARILLAEYKRYGRFPASRDLFAPNGRPLRAGEKLVQKDLARTLRLLAASGPLTFYEGAVAEQIVKEMQRAHGLLTAADLASYRAVERAPLRGRYRDLEILVPPPPSSGGITLLQMLAMLEPNDLASMPPLQHGSGAHGGRSHDARLCGPRLVSRRPGFRARADYGFAGAGVSRVATAGVEARSRDNGGGSRRCVAIHPRRASTGGGSSSFVRGYRREYDASLGRGWARKLRRLDHDAECRDGKRCLGAWCGIPAQQRDG